MDFFISSAAAQAAGPAEPSIFGLLLPFILVLVFMYFVILRPQAKRAKEHRALIDRLAKGVEVVTTGGILGRIEEISDSFVTLEVATGTKIKVQKHAVVAEVPKGTMKSA